MPCPVRCFTCGKVIDPFWPEYKERTEVKNEVASKVLTDLNITKFCCRRMLLTHVDNDDEQLLYGAYYECAKDDEDEDDT
jgi:DNA-directed RNA polymerase subunit N